MSAARRATFGVVGLGVMGRNLALNLSDHEERVAVWNHREAVQQEFVRQHSTRNFAGAPMLADLVASLERPRRILMMITAGAPVDTVLEQLLPLLEDGDVVVDGGNSHFVDTQRRERNARAAGVRFVGMGVSGGAEGARHGPSLMPGCDASAYELLRPSLERIAARTDFGPCVTHVGPDGAGHFVKMVHNGIEYADMQLIAEAYDVLRRDVGLDASALHALFTRWNDGPLQSFLIELTAKLFAVHEPESGAPLVDLVLDEAQHKGTGRWAVEAALELSVAIPAVTAALDARVLSSRRAVRRGVQQRFGRRTAQPAGAWDGAVQCVHDALLAAKICVYAQGMELVAAASQRHGWKIDLRELARIWTGGCIIRARLLDRVMRAYERDPALPLLLLDPTLRDQVVQAEPGWRATVSRAHRLGIPVPASAATLAWLDAYRSAHLPQNLIQAQRDAFGSHGYVRRDHPEWGTVHTEWLPR